jgi:hypothetical protein
MEFMIAWILSMVSVASYYAECIQALISTLPFTARIELRASSLGSFFCPSYDPPNAYYVSGSLAWSGPERVIISSIRL